ncbi:hypothetical protein AA101099_1802 [Neoasaia chiangmaiensis NBRC 101099]|uniref:Uncharacterized protein n=1 Tax=Neoasaia chiangmaiensis TaxID=320497 RepID=A0A1U9KQV4_9PROT|nr:hypothetical protein [Neoasaia chiangmaiensis]AQS88241.1 hypothetical protein A0U93_10160 [Neoasaia chiangmaiensis]GBR39754.1 hypothetical protein AA101099_1802 [Neoasaia chiangmaiensis NBRC 101099]GEN14725.1 hypothetical protein NCH01_11560 [Neoasaia chiangmaiensis]
MTYGIHPRLAGLTDQAFREMISNRTPEQQAQLLDLQMRARFCRQRAEEALQKPNVGSYNAYRNSALQLEDELVDMLDRTRPKVPLRLIPPTPSVAAQIETIDVPPASPLELWIQRQVLALRHLAFAARPGEQK